MTEQTDAANLQKTGNASPSSSTSTPAANSTPAAADPAQTTNPLTPSTLNTGAQEPAKIDATTTQQPTTIDATKTADVSHVYLNDGTKDELASGGLVGSKSGDTGVLSTGGYTASTAEPIVTDVKSADAIAAQHERVDSDLDKLNEKNAEGFAKIEERIASEVPTEKALEVPVSGKARDVLGNTPTIDANGNKTWHY